ncbi:MAG TPA: amidase [Candidatus Binataceae bacterium]|nr:amidase [Candidatus Binataceae bacterium]
MKFQPPTTAELAEIAAQLGFRIPAGDLASFTALTAGLLESHRRLDQLSEPNPAPKYPRDSGWRPDASENPLGAWYWRTSIKGATSGPLAGKTIALKDTICLAGVPMMVGSGLLDGYVADLDATVVTRVLDAGGTVLGKAVCENLCLSSGSHTSASGIARNPYDPRRSPGGSSSGCAALVAAGAVDMAIGGDQAGSIRIPSSWSGIYGLKPTYGLVPYTGICAEDHTLDHTGPMARTVADVALMLEVIAGPDGLDPRQRAGLESQPFSRALTGDVKGLRLAIVKEGFGWEGMSERDVDEAVTAAAQAFERLGCSVETVSIPWHRDAVNIWSAICLEGATALLTEGNAMGSGWKGRHVTSLVEAYARGRATRAADLPPNVKLILMAGSYLHKKFHGHYYAKAQNLVRELAAAYQLAFATHDLLVMPTTPTKAALIPPPDATIEEQVARAFDAVANTCAFNLTGYPAINVPCAMSDGLPVGMMLCGRTGDDATVLRAADAFSRAIFAPPPPPAAQA